MTCVSFANIVTSMSPLLVLMVIFLSVISLMVWVGNRIFVGLGRVFVVEGGGGCLEGCDVGVWRHFLATDCTDFRLIVLFVMIWGEMLFLLRGREVLMGRGNGVDEIGWVLPAGCLVVSRRLGLGV